MDKVEKTRNKLKKENDKSVKEYAYKTMCVGGRKKSSFWNFFKRGK